MKYIFFIVTLTLLVPIFSQKPLLPHFNVEKQKWTYLDVNKKEVLVFKLPTIDSALLFNDGLAPVRDKKSKLWGYINTKGKIVIPTKFLSAGFFDAGFALVFNKCGQKCYTGDEGLLSDEIGSIIDKTGKIIYSDNSQDERVYARFFLTSNIGHGFFAFSRARSFGEVKAFLNYKGEILSDDVTSYGLSGIFWDEEMQAVKCGLKYYNSIGDIKLDLTYFQNIMAHFSEGYVWSTVVVDAGNETYEDLNVLVDSTGKAIVNMDLSEFNSFTDAKNGQVTCFSIPEKVYYVYDIKTAKFSIYEGSKVLNIEEILTIDEMFGKKLGDLRLIHDGQTEQLIAVLLPSNEKYYLKTDLD